MNHNSYLLLVGLYLFISCEKKEEHAKPYICQQMDSLLIHEHNSNRFDGTIVIGTRDSVIYSKAIGTANRVWDVPLQLDHRFDICSINKSFVAALVLMAVEEGKFDLDDRFVNLIQAHSYEGNFDQTLTIHQMLTHTSGIADYDLSANRFRAFKRKHFSNEDYINFISKLTPVNQPGQTFHYSNFAYHLLAILLEDIYQLPFAELLQKKICKPLDLERTFSTTSNSEVHKKLVEAYNYDKENDRWDRNRFIDFTLGRRIFSTAMHLYLWGKAMSGNSIFS